jgi:hypothetical protein
MYTSFTWRTMVRFLGIFVLTIVLVSFTPAYPRDEILAYLTPIPVATIFAIVIAFYINNAIARMNGIQNNVAIELSRVRRVHHLAMGLQTTELVGWAQELGELVIKYLKGFKKYSFKEYGQGNADFRALTYHIYKMDSGLLKTPKDTAVYQELLQTTREWALVRQNIQAFKKQNISLYSWFILGSVSAILISSLMFIRSENIFGTKLTSGLSIISVLFILDLLWELNSLNDKKCRLLAEKYVMNIERLKIGHLDK